MVLSFGPRDTDTDTYTHNSVDFGVFITHHHTLDPTWCRKPLFFGSRGTPLGREELRNALIR